MIIPFTGRRRSVCSARRGRRGMRTRASYGKAASEGNPMGHEVNQPAVHDTTDDRAAAAAGQLLRYYSTIRSYCTLQVTIHDESLINNII